MERVMEGGGDKKWVEMISFYFIFFVFCDTNITYKGYEICVPTTPTHPPPSGHNDRVFIYLYVYFTND
jgi:hypothetical protein